MSSVNENPVHQAVQALEHAMHAAREHHRHIAAQAAAARPLPAAAPAPAREPVAAGRGAA